ncbi:hypothetical protein Leryth_003923 [Lithospermum erythrorhizon]|nr:hypothetical protein Leryth_003923 [Lithospermum erythrorhizon]
MSRLGHLKATSRNSFLFCDIEYVEMQRARLSTSAGAFATHMTSETKVASGSESVFQKAEDVAKGMLAKGFILGKDAGQQGKVLSMTSTSCLLQQVLKLSFTRQENRSH